MISGFIGLPISIPVNSDAGQVLVSSTVIIQKPVDYALAGEQLIKDRYREWFVPAAKTTERTRVTTAGARMLGGKKSSFTSKTGKRGYD